MVRQGETQEPEGAGPDTSTLWLAIGLGGFSVFASFFLAIYCSPGAINEQAASVQTSAIETVEQTDTK